MRSQGTWSVALVGAAVGLLGACAASQRTDPGDGGAPECETVCFEWAERLPAVEGWAQDARCNPYGVEAGRCPAGFACGGGAPSSSFGLVHPACEPSNAASPGPYSFTFDHRTGRRLQAPEEIVLRFTLNGGPWPAGVATERPPAVALTPAEGGPTRMLEIAASGLLELSLDPGSYALRVDWYGSASLPATRRTGYLTVRASGEAVADLLMTSVEVTVVPTEPPSRAFVWMSGSHGQLRTVLSEAPIEDLQRWVLPVEPDGYDVGAELSWAEPEGSATLRMERGYVFAEGETASLTFAARSARGHVRIEGDPPWAVTHVFLHALDGQWWARAPLATDGTFAVPVPASSSGPIHVSLGTQQRPVHEVARGVSLASGLDLQLHAVPIAFALEWDGGPAPAAAGVVVAAPGHSWDGHHESRVLAQARYDVVVRHPSAWRRILADTRLSEGVVTLRVPLRRARIRVTLDGRPMTARERDLLPVTLHDADRSHRVQPQPLTLTRGWYEGWVPPGRYEVRLGHGDIHLDDGGPLWSRPADLPQGIGVVGSIVVDEDGASSAQLAASSVDVDVRITVDGGRMPDATPGSVRGGLGISRALSRGRTVWLRHRVPLSLRGEAQVSLRLFPGMYAFSHTCEGVDTDWLEGCDLRTLGASYGRIVVLANAIELR